MNFKPMLSASLDGVDLSTLRYPLLASPKLDGVRCIIWEGVAYSRNAKPIRNRFVQAWAKDKHNLDGELIVGSPTEGEVLGRTQSGVMSFEGEPDFTYHIFDYPERDCTFQDAYYGTERSEVEQDRIKLVLHEWVQGAGELQWREEYYLQLGYEGIMLRAPTGPYKNGRSTLREGYLMKLKRFIDGEGVVIALEEAMENTNELQRDELGRAKRSHAQEGLVGKGMIGTIIIKDNATGMEMRLSPGVMNHGERYNFWQCHKIAPDLGLVGQTVHWRAFGYGQKDMPRFPRFYGIREDV